MRDIEKIKSIKNLVGLRYVFLGRLKELPKSKKDVIRFNREGQGIDCYGTFLLIYKFLGYNIPDYVYAPGWYKGKDNDNLFIREYHKYFEKVEDLQLWDAVLFRIKSRVPNHIGVCLGNGEFIHCLENGSVCVGRLFDLWNKRTYGYLRVKDDCKI